MINVPRTTPSLSILRPLPTVDAARSTGFNREQLGPPRSCAPQEADGGAAAGGVGTRSGARWRSSGVAAMRAEHESEVSDFVSLLLSGTFRGALVVATYVLFILSIYIDSILQCTSIYIYMYFFLLSWG